MNRDWWASPTEAYIYNEFADALREAFRTGVLRKADLLGDDAHVLAKLRAARGGRIGREAPERPPVPARGRRGFTPRVMPKNRWLDPPVLEGTRLRRSPSGPDRRRRPGGSAQAGGAAGRS